MIDICNEEYPPKSNSGFDVIYCSYIPMTFTPSTWEKYERKLRAEKSYATVSLKHPNPYYRGKRGTICGRKEGMCLLEIETSSFTPKTGRNPWSWSRIKRYPDDYKKIWFSNDILETFEEYDENGDLKT